MERIRFGEFELDPRTGEVRKGRSCVRLQEQPLQILIMLLEKPGELVTREAIRRRLWAGDTVVEFDHSIGTAVKKLRQALGDEAEKPKYVETLPRRGFRFIFPEVTVAAQEESAAAQDHAVNSAGAQAPVAEAPTAQASAVRATAPRQRTLRAALVAATALMIVIAGMIVWRVLPKRGPSPTAAQPEAFKPVPFLSYPGWVGSMSFSPDGSEVAFQWDGGLGSYKNIYVKRVDSDASPLRLTSGAAEDSWPEWSHDGRSIAFERDVSDTEADLMVIPAHGGPERKLGAFPVWAATGGRTPVWSFNDKWLAVAVGAGSGVALYRVSVETGEDNPMIPPQESQECKFPVLSPDGKTLIYVLSPLYHAGDVWAVHVDADLNPLDTPRQIPAGLDRFSQAAFTADGEEIVGGVRNGDMVRMPAAGSDTPQPIPGINQFQGSFAISPRGNRLAFTMLQGAGNIWRIELKDAGLKTGAPHPEPLIVTGPHPGYQQSRTLYPQYSSDGGKLAFYSHRTGHSEIFIADSNGGNQRQLTRMNAVNTGTPHWSPDNRTIAFDSMASKIYQVYTISADGGAPRQMTFGAYSNFGSSWSRDGRWLYYSSQATGETEIWKMPAQGGAPLQVTRNGGSMATESLDGRTLFYCKESPTPSLWSAPAGGGPEELVIDSLYRTNYAVTGQGIYYMSAPGDDGRSQIMFLSFATRKSTLILPIGYPDYGLALSPDGRYLAYAEADDVTSTAMVVENFH
jgi:Tol biopolymer transport system component/DNA-binding winged helix-turn-helix (wHTH) protein